MDKWEAKRRYVERKNRENEEIKSLTPEQHDAIQELCAKRHEFHCSTESMWNRNAADLLNDFSDCNDYNMSYELKEVGLPELKLLISCDMPGEEDYYELLSDEEKEEWEEKADKFNEENPNAFFPHSGYTLWKEESWEYDTFLKICEKQNDIIEKYLREIDEKYGTEYCPTGIARFEGVI